MAWKGAGKRSKPSDLNSSYIDKRKCVSKSGAADFDSQKKSRTWAARLSQKILWSISYAKNFRRPQPKSPAKPVPSRSSEDGSGVGATPNGKGPAPPTKYPLTV